MLEARICSGETLIGGAGESRARRRAAMPTPADRRPVAIRCAAEQPENDRD